MSTALFVTLAALGSASFAGTPDAEGLRAAFTAGGTIGALALVVALYVPNRPR